MKTKIRLWHLTIDLEDSDGIETETFTSEADLHKAMQRIMDENKYAYDLTKGTVEGAFENFVEYQSMVVGNCDIYVWNSEEKELDLPILTQARDALLNAENYMAGQMDEAEAQDHMLAGHDASNCVLCEVREAIERLNTLEESPRDGATMTDTEAMNAIHENMSGEKDWSPDTLETIKHILDATGRKITDCND